MFDKNLKPGVTCKACDKPIDGRSGDPELCRTCMTIVLEMNRDITEPDFEFWDSDMLSLEEVDEEEEYETDV